jgi:hypothetical protein
MERGQEDGKASNQTEKSRAYIHAWSGIRILNADVEAAIAFNGN